MGFKFSNFKTDKALEENGVWVEYKEDFSMLIARFGNEKCQAFLRKLRKPHLRQLRRGTMDEKIGLEILRKATAKYILLGWKGLDDDTGIEIPYSEEKALELLQTRDFFDEVVDIANDMDTFKSEDNEDAEKNLPATSTGN
jgi:hypothetical protein